MRTLFLVTLLAVVAACYHSPLRARARSLGSGLASLGGRIAVVVRGSPALRQAAHDGLDHGIDQTAAAAERRDRDRDRDRDRRQGPPPIDRSPGPQQTVEPAPTPAGPAPDITVDRVDLSHPTVFVARWKAGGKWQCEQHPTQDACVSACTARLRMSMARPADDDSRAGCNCTEMDRGC